jgi:hypothetical protein
MVVSSQGKILRQARVVARGESGIRGEGVARRRGWWREARVGSEGCGKKARVVAEARVVAKGEGSSRGDGGLRVDQERSIALNSTVYSICIA